MTKKGLIGIVACLFTAAGLTLGCVDPEGEGGGRVGGTSLYVFDTSEGASSRVIVYSDLAALFEDTTIQPSRRLSGAKIDRVRNLAWGGMCFDSNGNRLYLVSESGDVVRIERARSSSTNGELTNPLDIVVFRLGDSDSDRLAGGKFGQASINSMGTTLYVTEANTSDTRIWAVTNPSSYMDGSSVSRDGQISVSGDKGGTGVAIGNDGSVYAYFDEGNSPFISGISYAGARLRRGNASGFQDQANVIIGRAGENRTELAKYGSLAVDNTSNIYLARHLADAAVTGNAILLFTSGHFNPGLNQAPKTSFAPINNLRVISHAVTKDWLVGALSDGEMGRSTVWMWRSPSMGTSATAKEFSVASGAAIRGLALDGSN